jgi:hypothetical protein
LIAQEAQYRDWMLAALMGDAGAYRMLLAGLTRHLRSYYARRLDSGAAEDAVQETLIAIHTRRATYDPGLPFTAATSAAPPCPWRKLAICSVMTRRKKPSPGAT